MATKLFPVIETAKTKGKIRFFAYFYRRFESLLLRSLFAAPVKCGKFILVARPRFYLKNTTEIQNKQPQV
jgi:hypothetical protein